MLSHDQAIPLEMLLEAARRRVAETNLRAAAAEIGMEHSGLYHLLRGTSPRPSTVRKLTDWYVRRAAEGGFDPPPELIDAAVALLLQHLPTRSREAVERQLVKFLGIQTKVSGVPVPKWIEDREA